MDVLIETLNDWYQTNRTLYATAATLCVVAVGSLLGWLMDLVGRLLGVDTHAVRHHREHL